MPRPPVLAAPLSRFRQLVLPGYRTPEAKLGVPFVAHWLLWYDLIYN